MAFTPAFPPPTPEVDEWTRQIVWPILKRVDVFSQSWTPSNCAANTSAEQTTTVTGVGVDDYVLSVNPPSSTAGIGVVGWRVSAADTVAVTFMNTTGSSAAPPSGTYDFVILRYRGNL